MSGPRLSLRPLAALAPLATALCLSGALAGCGPPCGPSEGVIASVIDGDTVSLESGEVVRLLMVDTPEVGADAECFSAEALRFTRDLALGSPVRLRYDQVCTDRFDRLLAYVEVAGRDLNRLLVERGYACVLHIPPNGDSELDAFEALESSARDAGRGLWGSCDPLPCGP